MCNKIIYLVQNNGKEVYMKDKKKLLIVIGCIVLGIIGIVAGILVFGILKKPSLLSLVNKANR